MLRSWTLVGQHVHTLIGAACNKANQKCSVADFSKESVTICHWDGTLEQCRFACNDVKRNQFQSKHGAMIEMECVLNGMSGVFS